LPGDHADLIALADRFKPDSATVGFGRSAPFSLSD
jgi:hypothetical protein